MQQISLRKALPLQLSGRISVALVLVALTSRQVSASPSTDAANSTLASSHYTLVGIAEFGGTSYASFADWQTGNHFLLSTNTKPQLDVALSSVKTDEDPTGPAAIIEKDSVSLLIKLQSDISLASSDSPSLPVVAQPYATQNIPRPGSPRVGQLKPPPGATLPLVFQDVDPQKMTLTDEQKATLKQLRQDFINAVNGTGSGSVIADANSKTSASDPGENANSTGTAPQTPATSDQILQAWNATQEHSDEMFRMLYGFQAFNAYTESSSYPTPP